MQTPLFFWGDGMLALTGFVHTARAVSLLARLGHRTFRVPTPAGPRALAGLLSPSYQGSSAGPYRGFFFGLFVEDRGWDPRHPMPGFQFLQFYDSTELSTRAGSLWGIDKKLAPIDNSYAKSRRHAEVFYRGNTMAKMVWNVLPLERPGPVVQRRFHNFPDSGGPGARILVNGRESAARFRPGVDEYSFAPATPLGQVLDDLAFSPQYWTFTHQAHGVYFLPDDRGRAR